MLTPSVIAAIVVSLHVLGVIAALHAVMTVRTAPGAIAWAGSLVMMPYFSLIPYLIFGRSRFADTSMRGASTITGCARSART
jgi:cardiolipin synthase